MSKTGRVLTVAVAVSALFFSPPAWADAEPDWDALAQCESSGNWQIDSGNGYYGGIQFDPDTWRAYKPKGYPEYAHKATKEQQIAVGRIVLQKQGSGAWPTCSAKTGWHRK